MITFDTVCGRTTRIRTKDLTDAIWEDGVDCCDMCRSILSARNSWREVYA